MIFEVRRLGWPLLAIVMLGCSSSTLQLYARPNGLPPVLSGRTVAVLPPITFGADPVNAVIFDRANACIFRGDLGGVGFLGSEQIRVQISAVPGGVQSFEQWSARAHRRLFFPAEGSAVQLHGGKQPLAGGVVLDQDVDFRSGGGATAGLLPDRIDPAWLGALDADYVLASMSYTKFREESGIYALFGIIPFAGYSYGGPADVRAHYGLYDRRSGQRIWEAYLGVETGKTSPRKWSDYPVDPRAGPAIAAAWILARDAQEALSRLLAEDPRHSDRGAPGS